MDRGLIFSTGVLFGALGIVLLFWLLLLTDEAARAYFSDLLRRLGAGRSTPEAQGKQSPRQAARQSETPSQILSGREQPRASCGSGARGISALLLAAVLGGCASGGRVVTAPAVAAPVEMLPACGFEAPYLPEPCRMQVAPGEWLAISNPHPEPTRHHGWLWWLLIGLVTL